MRLPQRAKTLTESLATVPEWAALGIPACTSRAGTYDFVTTFWWALGHRLQKKLDAITTKAQLTPVQKVAAGWLLSRGVGTEQRRDMFGNYLDNLERCGIQSMQGFEALHVAASMFEALGMYPGRLATGIYHCG